MASPSKHTFGLACVAPAIFPRHLGLKRSPRGAGHLRGGQASIGKLVWGGRLKNSLGCSLHEHEITSKMSGTLENQKYNRFACPMVISFPEIALGLGCSHGPIILTPPQAWAKGRERIFARVPNYSHHRSSWKNSDRTRGSVRTLQTNSASWRR